jgi:hypothetical protein
MTNFFLLLDMKGFTMSTVYITGIVICLL